MNTFKIGQITDSHLYGGGCGLADEPGMQRRDAFYCDCLREVAAHGVDLIVHTGDLVNGDRGKPYHQRFKDLLDEMADELGLPILICRGNHDAQITDEEYIDVWGTGNWLHEHKGWSFLGVDRYWKTYSHGGAQFAMSPESFEEVDELLAKVPGDRPLAVMLHDNPVGISDFWHGEAFLYRLAQKNCRFLLFGHVQGNWVSTYQGIPHYTVVGERQCFDSSPLSYNIVTCFENGDHACDFFSYRTNTPPRKEPAAPSRKSIGIRAEDDWADFRGPLGTRATERELPATAPSLVWKTSLPGGLSIGAPTLQDGLLYVGTKTHGRFEQCAAVALDAESGHILWKTPLDGSAEGGVLLEGGRGYVGTTAGSIVAIDLADGREAWTWNSGENIPIACPLAYDPAERILHAGANFEMYAVRAEDGSTLWRTTTTLQGCGYFTGGHGSPAVSHDRVFHRRPYGAWGDENRSMIAVDKFTGKNPTRLDPAYYDQPMMRHASPIIHREFIIAAGAGLWVGPLNAKLEGKPLIWKPHTQAGATPAAMELDVIVSYHSEIVAYDLYNGGRERWRVPHEPALLHFGGGEGSRFPSNYGEYPTNGTFASPLICADKVLVCDTAGLCRCFRRNDGGELWRLEFGEPILCAPVVSGNALFLGDYRGQLYAFAW